MTNKKTYIYKYIIYKIKILIFLFYLIKKKKKKKKKLTILYFQVVLTYKLTFLN